jgi:hypothetical protein
LRGLVRERRVVAGCGDDVGCRELRRCVARNRSRELVRELLGDATGQRVGDRVDVSLHRIQVFASAAVSCAASC